VNQALNNPIAKWKFEDVAKQILNQNAETGLFFHSFTVLEESSKRNRSRGRGTGMCKNKKCRPPPSVALSQTKTKAKYMMRGLDLLANLKTTVVELPEFEYDMEHEEKNDVVTYEAIFHVKIIKPWESLEKISLTAIVGGFEEEATSACKVDKGACETQLQSITSVFYQLQADFDDNTHECSWPGVVCDDQNIIIKLHIENKNDTEKEFPQECAELHHLTDLFLRNNGITGILPTTLGNLKSIRYLSLENNKLKEEIPSELGLLTNMKELRLNRNDLYGGIPSHLGNAEELKILDLSRNKSLGGSIPVEMGNLRNLKTLILYNCAINEALPGNLKSLTVLEEILLGENRLTGNIEIFSELSALKVLDLAENDFTGSIPNSIENLHQLNILNLYNNKMTGSIPPSLYSLSLLKEIVLAKNDFKKNILSQIGNLTNLKIFDVDDNDLTNKLPSEIGNLKNLITLNLHGNELDGKIPSELGQLSELVEMAISGNKFTGPLPAELSHITKIKFLDIGHNLLTGSIPTALNEQQNLNEMYIWGNGLTGNIAFLCDLPVFFYDIGEFDPSCTYILDQKNAMKLFYTALNQTYYQSNPECEWKGTTCNNHGSILSINLAGEDLDGSIHSAIGQLHELEVLDLSNNKLTGTVPKEIVTSLFLKSLNLGGNNLSGDAHFLCGVSFEAFVDDSEVDKCTSSPSSVPSLSPTLLPSLLPSTSPSQSPTTFWSQVGDDVDDKDMRHLGRSVALSNDGDRLWAGGEGLLFYVFDGDDWNSSHDFSPDVPKDRVYSISVSADGRAFVACYTYAAWVFQELDLVWEQKGETLTGGVSVAMNGNGTVIVVGAPDNVELFVHEDNQLTLQDKGNQWTLQDKIDGQSDSKFGSSVALSSDGTRLIVGAYYAQNNGVYSGSLYLYTLFPRLELQRIDGGKEDFLGDCVSMSSDGSVVVAGSYVGNYVKIFRAIDASLLQYEQMGANIQGGSGTFFGTSVSLSSDGRRFAVGAPYNNDEGTYSGKVFVYAINDDDYKLIGEFFGEFHGDRFGWSVSMSGDGRRVAGGAPERNVDEDYSGHVRVYNRNAM